MAGSAKAVDATNQVFQQSKTGTLKSQESAQKEGVSIQAKLSQEEEELRKTMAFAKKDSHGGIAIQTSSKTLPGLKEGAKSGLSRRGSRSRAHPSKAGMTHFEQQIKQSDLERTSRASKYRDSATDPKTRDELVGAK